MSDFWGASFWPPLISSQPSDCKAYHCKKQFLKSIKRSVSCWLFSRKKILIQTCSAGHMKMTILLLAQITQNDKMLWWTLGSVSDNHVWLKARNLTNPLRTMMNMQRSNTPEDIHAIIRVVLAFLWNCNSASVEANWIIMQHSLKEKFKMLKRWSYKTVASSEKFLVSGRSY